MLVCRWPKRWLRPDCKGADQRDAADDATAKADADADDFNDNDERRRCRRRAADAENYFSVFGKP